MPAKPQALVAIDNKVFYRQVAALVVPMALQNLINVGVQSADVIMLGRVGETVLSASSLAGQVQFVLMLFFFGLSSGATVLTAQYWGKGDTRTIEKILALTLRFSFAMAIIFFVGATFFPANLMRIFTGDPTLITEGAKYLRLIAPGYLLTAFSNIYLLLMRSIERVLISTVVYLISLVTNVALNAVLIFGLLGFPAMGIEGAALATTIARAIEFTIVAIYAARNKTVRLRLKDLLSFDKGLLKDFMRYSLPTTLNELIWGSAMSATAMIIGRLGEAAVAANSVAQVTRQLATVVCFGLAGATAVILGKTLGAGEPEKARAYASKFVRLTLISGSLGAIVIQLIRPVVLSFMRLSPEAHGYLSFLLIWMSIYVIAQSYTTTMIVGVFRSGGDARFGLVLDAGVMWGVSIALGAVAAFVLHWPVPYVYMVIMADEFVKVPFVIIRYRQGAWLRNVTR